MKLFLGIVWLLLISHNCFSQVLAGEWKGSFTVDHQANYSLVIPISLSFGFNEDHTYDVRSYSQSDGQTIICKVVYEIVNADSIYLEETEILKPQNITAQCPQKMFLEIRTNKKSMVLTGRWESEACDLRGTIRFSKNE